MARLPIALCTTASLCLVACADGGGAGEATELVAVRDTVGDTLVVRTLSGSAWGSDARLVPEMSFGEMDGAPEYLLGEVGSLGVGTDGTIYVLDQQARELRAYDADGRYLRTLAGRGEGPGELNEPAALAVLSDGRVVVRDPGNTRLQVFSADGSESWEWPVVRGGMMSSSPLWQDENDNVYVFVVLNPEGDFGTWRVGHARIHPDGAQGDTLTLPETGFEEAVVEARNENSASMNVVPFSPVETMAIHPGGYFIHGISDRYAFTLLREDLPLRIERVADPVPVQQDEGAARRRRIERSLRRLQPGWDWNGPGIPTTKAPYRRFLVTRDGRIWVQVAQPGFQEENPDHDLRREGSEPTRWREPLAYDVFGEDGTYFGRVHPPEDFTDRATPVIDGDRVWAVTADALGVQRVVRFRVTTDAGGP